MTNPNPPSVAATPPLADALDKTKQAAETVKEAADDLAVIHTVLDTELPENARSGDVGNAVEQTQALEKKLDDAADLLDEANETVEKEVQARDGTSDGASR
jgi:hypothetical protein